MFAPTFPTAKNNLNENYDIRTKKNTAEAVFIQL